MAHVEVELGDDELLIGAVVLYKVLKSDGGIVFRERYGSDLSNPEQLGMLETAADTVRAKLMGSRH